MSGVVHFEIPADDEARARQFYNAAFDWRLDALPDLGYTNVQTTPVDETTQVPLQAGAINGGLFERSGDLVHPIITVDVDDISATLERITSLGGAIVQPKTAIPGMGYFGYFRDTEGNVLGLWTTAADAA
ncbi:MULTISPECIES: VOC family protein [unclassified Diaminobutyricimonas]|uniref:VOC family protein n=1 Tax=unclassified Diaminobutyricimonas TaxID=2643261 RepID=UPI0012F52865|nr:MULTISPECIES: VOC family protein [unclassified Diaminobutyricimonas]